MAVEGKKERNEKMRKREFFFLEEARGFSIAARQRNINVELGITGKIERTDLWTDGRTNLTDGQSDSKLQYICHSHAVSVIFRLHSAPLPLSPFSSSSTTSYSSTTSSTTTFPSIASSSSTSSSSSSAIFTSVHLSGSRGSAKPSPTVLVRSGGNNSRGDED